MGADIPVAEKEKAVDEIIDLLELGTYANMIVGHESLNEGVPYLDIMWRARR